MVVVQLGTHDYDLYILEQPFSWSTSRIHLSWPRSRLGLSLLLVFLSECISCLLCPSRILLFVPTDRVSHLYPSSLSGGLLTNVQVNNITTLHDTHGHTYIHHIGITIVLPFYTSCTLLGKAAGPDPSRLTQYFQTDLYGTDLDSKAQTSERNIWIISRPNHVPFELLRY